MDLCNICNVHYTHSTDLVTHPQHLEPSVCEGDGERGREQEREGGRERERERQGGKEGEREKLRCMWLCLIITVC